MAKPCAPAVSVRSQISIRHEKMIYVSLFQGDMIGAGCTTSHMQGASLKQIISHLCVLVMPVERARMSEEYHSAARPHANYRPVHNKTRTFVQVSKLDPKWSTLGSQIA